MPIQRVHIVFKTHLDLGFTDLAARVVARYEHGFIPRAIELARECRGEDGAMRFRWTTGSWLIDYVLARGDAPTAKALAEAIEAGYIVWHALPFTVHSELLDASLFDYGLSIARRLDRRFGRQTIAAKMTDVPGHTLGIVPRLAAAGVRYLHIGVNSASSRPRVPRLFLWKVGGAEVVVHYADSYGDQTPVAGLDEALVFSFSGDNQGPPTKEGIERAWRDLRSQYPHAEMVASTLDAFAESVWDRRGMLPVVTEELGDTWIHGAASDPGKLAGFRALLRLRREWLESGELTADQLEAFSSSLLMVPEHTWGVDHKKYLGDFVHYAKPDFERARRLDRVGDAVPAKYAYLRPFIGGENVAPVPDFGPDSPSGARAYSFLEASWREQRQYLEDAVEVLPELNRAKARDELARLGPKRGDTDAWAALPLGEEHALGMFRVGWGDDGAIHSLQNPRGRQWTRDECPIGRFSYETFGLEDYQRWYRQYIVHWHETHPWADADFGKPGFEFAQPAPARRCFLPHGATAKWHRDPDVDRVVVSLRMDPEAAAIYACPRVLETEFAFSRRREAVDIEFRWFDKDAGRLPEALWFSFGFAVDNPHRWMLDKLGVRVSPLNVVRGGNRAMHAVDGGMYYNAADGRISLETEDAAVVSVGGRHLLDFRSEVAPLTGGLHVNLFNNVWGTNFPAWTDEDASFRFQLSFEDTAT